MTPGELILNAAAVGAAFIILSIAVALSVTIITAAVRGKKEQSK